MIHIKATWVLNMKNEFPDQIKLMVRCPNCDIEYDNILYILRLIPNCLGYIKPKTNGNRKVALIDECPRCNFEFTITSLSLIEVFT